MTRFARAKGSKASNERLPEEATTWSEMKQQLLEKNKEVEESKKRKDAIESRNANYKAFLEEKEMDSIKNTSWADFPNTLNSAPKKKKNNKSKNGVLSTSDNTLGKNNKKQEEINNSKLAKDDDSDEPPEEESSKKEIAAPVVKKKKVKSKKLLKITNQNKECENQNTNNNNDKPVKKRRATEDGQGKIKKLKTTFDKNDVKNKQNKLQNKKVLPDNLPEEALKRIEKKKQKRIKQLEKKKRIKEELKKQKQEEKKAEENSETKTEQVPIDNQELVKSSNNNNTKVNVKKPFNKLVEKNKKNKVRDGEERQRKKPLLPHKMFINGKELEIEYVEGFPVKKEDAARLKKLRREMISKGLPRSEINAALKLERRKAEKAFAREKKKVCFHCRMSGHNLSECPAFDKNEVAQTTQASGICFKCGSTEHTHFECKVVRGQEFKFASCFICKEQGHIARQCPDNARGLYPKGGACKVCGDVTHLKRDCPKYQIQQQNQEESVRIETLGGSNPDVLDEKSEDRGGTPSKSFNKIIKF